MTTMSYEEPWARVSNTAFNHFPAVIDTPILTHVFPPLVDCVTSQDQLISDVVQLTRGFRVLAGI
jgi:hypothetical protein